MKSAVMPKTIARWIDKNKEVIDEYWFESDGYMEGEDYSIWLYLKEGYINWMTETHCIHEATVKDFMEHTKYIKKESEWEKEREENIRETKERLNEIQ